MAEEDGFGEGLFGAAANMAGLSSTRTPRAWPGPLEDILGREIVYGPFEGDYDAGRHRKWIYHCLQGEGDLLNISPEELRVYQSKSHQTRRSGMMPLRRDLPQLLSWMSAALQSEADEDGVCDVVFSCPVSLPQDPTEEVPPGAPRERFPSIRALFALRSPVFHRMLFGPMARPAGQREQLNVIELNSVSARIFSIVRTFVYTAAFAAEDDDLVDILHAADMFALDDLYRAARDELFNAVRTPRAAVRIWAQLLRRGLPSVEEEVRACTKEVLSKGSAALRTPDFLELPLEVVEFLVSSDLLSVEREVEVLEAVVRWGRKQAGLEPQDAFFASPSSEAKAASPKDSEGEEENEEDPAWSTELVQRMTSPQSASAAGAGAPADETEEAGSGRSYREQLRVIEPIIDRLLGYVRFGLMSPAELSQHVVPRWLLDERTLLQLFAATSVGQLGDSVSRHTAALLRQELPFPAKPRSLSIPDDRVLVLVGTSTDVPSSEGRVLCFDPKHERWIAVKFATVWQVAPSTPPRANVSASSVKPEEHATHPTKGEQEGGRGTEGKEEPAAAPAAAEAEREEGEERPAERDAPAAAEEGEKAAPVGGMPPEAWWAEREQEPIESGWNTVTRRGGETTTHFGVSFGGGTPAPAAPSGHPLEGTPAAGGFSFREERAATQAQAQGPTKPFPPFSLQRTPSEEERYKAVSPRSHFAMVHTADNGFVFIGGRVRLPGMASAAPESDGVEVGRLERTERFPASPASSSRPRTAIPVPNRFARGLPSLITARSSHAAVELPDGRILVLGGRRGDADLDTMEVLEPVPGSDEVDEEEKEGEAGDDVGEAEFSVTAWKPVSPPTDDSDMERTSLATSAVATGVPTEAATAAPDASEPAAGGGGGGGGGGGEGDGEEEEEGRQEWGTPLAGAEHTAVLPIGLARSLRPVRTQRDAGERPQTSSLNGVPLRWRQLSVRMPHAMSGHVAVVLEGGEVLVAGGRGDVAKEAYIFDPVAETWWQTAPMARAHAYASAVRLEDGRVLVAGGASATDTPHPECEVYNAVTNEWKVVSSMASPRRDSAAVPLPGGRAAVIGGLRMNGACAEGVEIFDSTMEMWTPLHNHNQSQATRRVAHQALLLPRSMAVEFGLLSGKEPVLAPPVAMPVAEESTKKSSKKKLASGKAKRGRGRR